MSSKKKKNTSGQGVNFAVTIVTFSMIFIFVGFLLGQYVVKLLKQQHDNTMQLARQAATTPAASTAPKNPTPSAAQATITPANTIPVSPVQAPQTQQTNQAPTGALYRVQVGVYSEKANADRMVTQLKEAGYEAILISGPPHRVQTGAFSSQENANKLVEELKRKGFEAIIVR